MKILSARQMAEWDKLSIQEYAKDPKKLMKQAAQVCLEVCLNIFQFSNKSKIVIVCGPGNNGGDGFALAHLLEQKEIPIKVFFSGTLDKLSNEARYFYNLVKSTIHSLYSQKDLSLFKRSIKDANYIVDAIFGIGLNRNLSDFYKKIIHMINQSSALKVAIDMPSGINGDNGKVMGDAIKADLTVTFEAPKIGQLLPQAWDHVGKLYVKSIGLSKAAQKKINSSLQWIDEIMVKHKLKRRPYNVHKGIFGKLLVVAGSSQMPGAGYLTCLGALRMGVGKVVWGMPTKVFVKSDNLTPEIILEEFSQHSDFFSLPLDKKHLQWINSFNAIAIGPGIGQAAATKDFIFELIKKIRIPCVLDADALNLISSEVSMLPYLKGKILTPHAKELAKISKCSVKEAIYDRLEISKNFATKNQLWILAKGYRTTIVEPKGRAWINSSGGPNLAIPGSGDVLTGMIASLLAQGFPKIEALIIACYLHGVAGDAWSEKNGDRGMLASEIAHMLPQVLKKIMLGRNNQKI